MRLGLFQSTPPARGATALRLDQLHIIDISIHAPREGGDLGERSDVDESDYFNPRPPRGGRPRSLHVLEKPVLFQSTPPARGATCLRFAALTWSVISIHAPREGGDEGIHRHRPGHQISIHAPREGGDRDSRYRRQLWSISIHAPREGGDMTKAPDAQEEAEFQSTPPARGATIPLFHSNPAVEFQSTPPARGATAKMHSFTCGSLTNK